MQKKWMTSKFLLLNSEKSKGFNYLAQKTLHVVLCNIHYIAKSIGSPPSNEQV